MKWNAPQRRAAAALKDPGCSRLVFQAANRVGKSTWIMDIVADCLTGLYACSDCKSNHDTTCQTCHGAAWCPTPCRIVLVAIAKHQAASAMGDMIRAMLENIPEWMIATVHEDKGLIHYVRLRTGSVFEVKTSKSREGAMQGFGANLVILDEHCPRPVYREVSMRKKAGQVLKIILDYTPTEGRTWVDEELIDQSVPGVRVVRGAIFENGEGPCGTCGKSQAQWDETLGNYTRTARWHKQLKRLCPRCHTFGTEPRFDRQWLDEQEAEMDTWEISTRLYGESVTLAGNAFFDPAEQAALRAMIRDPDAAMGGQTRWSPPLEPAPWPQPIRGRDYVIGVDGAEGRGGDEAVMMALDAQSGEIAAIWADYHTPPEVYVEDVRLLALELQARKVCVEHEKSGAVVNNLLRSTPGIHLYRHRSVDGRFVKSSGQLGFRPSGPTTYRILRQVIKRIRRTLELQPDGKYAVIPGVKNGLYVYDHETVLQICGLFVDDRGKIQTVTKHDDRVMAVAMAVEAWESLGGASKTRTRAKDDVLQDDEIEKYWRKRADHYPDVNGWAG